ncbi:MAG: hypothetical protein IJ193_04850 [Bacilli bacterium]|nr:hypothetical protein [Bacilli bacterium]
MYNIQKNFNKIIKGQPTFFLDPKEQMELKGKLHKDEYHIYAPYPDSEKVIFYKNSLPEVLLYEIISTTSLRHQDILGTMFSLQIANEMFGDIILTNGHYYIYILKLFQNYFETNFVSVRNSSIELREVPLSTLEDYHREYEPLELNVSSERIDTVISRILNTSRSQIEEKYKNKEILYNHDFLKNLSVKLKVGDTFSIKRIGKFQYMGILKNTKSGHYIVSVYQYK